MPQHQRQDDDGELLERDGPTEDDRRQDEGDAPEASVAIGEHEDREREHDEE